MKVASCVIKGSYDQMGEAYATVASWIKENGYKMSGPMFNIYHVSPAQTQNPDEYVTEACFPIEQICSSSMLSFVIRIYSGGKCVGTD